MNMVINIKTATKHLDTEDRNALVLRMEDDIRKLLKTHRGDLRLAGMSMEDAYQELVLCAIEAIDRCKASDEATVRAYVMNRLPRKVESITSQPVGTTIPFGPITRYGYEIGLGVAA
jgi:hypothetical protein